MSKHKALAATHLRIALKLLELETTSSQQEQELLLLHIQSAMALLQEDRVYPEDDLPSEHTLEARENAKRADASELAFPIVDLKVGQEKESSAVPTLDERPNSTPSQQDEPSRPAKPRTERGALSKSPGTLETSSVAKGSVESDSTVELKKESDVSPVRSSFSQSSPPKTPVEEIEGSAPSEKTECESTANPSTAATIVEESPITDTVSSARPRDSLVRHSEPSAHSEHRHPPEIIADAFSRRSTLVDSMQSHARTKASRLSSIRSLAQSFSFNDQRHYVKELFGGNKELFVSSVRQMDKASSMIEALDILHEAYDGPPDNPALESFVTLLERRFNV